MLARYAHTSRCIPEAIRPCTKCMKHLRNTAWRCASASMVHYCAEQSAEPFAKRSACLLMFVRMYFTLCSRSFMQGEQDDSDAAVVNEDNLAESLGEALQHCLHCTQKSDDTVYTITSIVALKDTATQAPWIPGSFSPKQVPLYSAACISMLLHFVSASQCCCNCVSIPCTESQ